MKVVNLTFNPLKLSSPPGLHIISVQLLSNLQRAQGLHVHHQALLQGGPHHPQPRVLQDQQRGRSAVQLQPRGAAGDDDHESTGRREGIKPSCHPTMSTQVRLSLFLVPLTLGPTSNQEFLFISKDIH